MIPSGLCKLPTANTIYLACLQSFPNGLHSPLPLDLLFLLRCCCSTLAMSYNLAYYIQVTHTTVFIAFGEHSAMIDCTSRNEQNMVILVSVVF